MRSIISTLIAIAVLAPSAAMAAPAINWNGDAMAGFRGRMAEKGLVLARNKPGKTVRWGKKRVEASRHRKPKKQALAGFSVELRIGPNGTVLRSHRRDHRRWRHRQGPQWGWYRDRRGTLRYGPIPHRRYNKRHRRHRRHLRRHRRRHDDYRRDRDRGRHRRR